MARKQNDPTVPTKNKDGKDTYLIHTIGDLTVLYNHLSPKQRELLLMDLINGIQKGSEAIDRTPSLLRGLLRASIRLSPVKWIDDDKGKVSYTVRMQEGDDPLYTEEL